MFYYYDMGYWGVLIITTVLGLTTQAYIRATYKKWSKVPGSFGTTGAEVARNMLNTYGASRVGIAHVGGHLSDYYDPHDNKLHLSEENYEAGSVASVAVACHEAGHAIQAATGFVPIKVRQALVPVVKFTQSYWVIVFMMGIFMGVNTSLGYSLMGLAILLYVFTVLFQIVTLPVEIDASRRAVAYLSQAGTGLDQRGAKQVLTAAALTYVAAALASIIQLMYLLSRSRRWN